MNEYEKIDNMIKILSDEPTLEERIELLEKEIVALREYISHLEYPVRLRTTATSSGNTITIYESNN